MNSEEFAAQCTRELCNAIDLTLQAVTDLTPIFNGDVSKALKNAGGLIKTSYVQHSIGKTNTMMLDVIMFQAVSFIQSPLESYEQLKKSLEGFGDNIQFDEEANEEANEQWANRKDLDEKTKAILEAHRDIVNWIGNGDEVDHARISARIAEAYPDGEAGLNKHVQDLITKLSRVAPPNIALNLEKLRDKAIEPPTDDSLFADMPGLTADMFGLRKKKGNGNSGS